MGILNVTPDSFYDGSEYNNGQHLIKQLDELYNADIIDIGAESSRPGAKAVPLKEELKRIDNTIPYLSNRNNTYSIDTYKPQIADFALKNGFSIINDITAASSNKMFDIAAKHSSKIILMHMQGNPKNMQLNPHYENIIDDICSFFEKRLEVALNHGLSEDQLIIDPGIGFGKSVTDNDKILNSISEFKKLGFPVLIGLSRKSFLNCDNDAPRDRLSTTIAANTLTIINGADIIRVHDVKEHLKVRSIIQRILGNFITS